MTKQNTGGRFTANDLRAKLAIALTVVFSAGAVFFFSVSKPTEESPDPYLRSKTEVEPRKTALQRPNQPTISSIGNRVANIRVGPKTMDFFPNARGEYSGIHIDPWSIVKASVPFPSAQAGEIVSVHSEDGGTLKGGTANGSYEVGVNQRIDLEFHAQAGPGLYRITLRRGGEIRVLEFWIAERPPVFVRNS